MLDCYETTTEEEKMQGGRTSRERMEKKKEDIRPTIMRIYDKLF